LMFPVRCFTCGKVLAGKWEEYEKRVSQGETPAKVLDSLGIRRYCCRRIFISYVPLVDDIVEFSSSKVSQKVNQNE